MAIHKGKIRQRNSGGTYDYLLPETTIDMVNGLQDELDSINTNLDNAVSKSEVRSVSINVLFPPDGLQPVILSSADNSSAINAMINYLTPGGELLFPIGTVNITNPIIIHKNQITLRGFAQRSIIQNNGTGNAIEAGDTVNNFSRIKFEGLRVMGNDNSGVGLYAQLITSRLIIRDCEFSGHGDAGAYIRSCFASVIDSSNFSSNCKSTNRLFQAGIYAEYSHNLSITSSHCFGNLNQADGIRVIYGGGASIVGCQFEANDRYGGNIQSCRGLNWSGNYVEHKGSHGLYITGTDEIRTHGVSITGGTFNGTDQASYGVTVSYADGVNISGICSYRHTQASVRVANTSTNVVISGIATRLGNEDPQFLSNSAIDTSLLVGNKFMNDVIVNQNNYLRFGNQYLWVDNLGKLRIKNGVPTSNTDGTIVGTQS